MTKKKKLTQEFVDIDDDEIVIEDKEWVKRRMGFSDYSTMTTHKPTIDNQKAVIAMRLAEIPVNRIAKVLGLSTRILKKYYKAELETAIDHVEKLVMTKLLEGIKEGNSQLIQFYLKNKKQWNDKQVIEVEHKAARPREEIEAELKDLGVPDEKLKDI